VLAATHAAAADGRRRAPARRRFDAFWLVGGRIVDWGPLGDDDEVQERTVRALRGGDGTGAIASLTPDEVAESRIVATWLDRNEATVHPLEAAPVA
jgi:hypothetical protein